MTPPNSSQLLLEEPLIRTPFELLRRSHRSAQRQVEKDFSAITTALSSLAKSKEVTKDAALSRLEQASERVTGLKRKLDDLQPSSANPSALRDRLTYLTARAEENKSEPSTDDTTLDRYIIDYLLRSGRVKAARALAARQNIDSLVDVKLFTELSRIETALIDKHSCAEGLSWCGENRGTLKKNNSNLEFILRLQEFIELCRKRDTVSAITYARKNLSPWATSHMVEIQQGMTLLAFGETTGVALYRKLYDSTRWSEVRDLFRSTFLELYSLPSQSILSMSLWAGLASLRLPSCVHIDAELGKKDPSNPTSAATKGVQVGLAPIQPIVPLLPTAPPLHTLDAMEIDDPLSALGGFGPDRPGGFGFNSVSPSSSTAASGPLGAAIASGAPITTGTIADELRAHPDTAVGNVDCPTCGDELRVLASQVPMAHHTNSTIVCRISGQVMDSENEPMAFPNGYVYSSKALAEMAKNNFDVVTCPRTRESCAYPRLRKVYIS